VISGGGINWQSASRTLVATPDGGTTLNQPDAFLLSLMALPVDTAAI
jgi:hypothetical protein